MSDHGAVLTVGDPAIDAAIAKAVGGEVERARMERGWSRIQLVDRLPSGITDRTLMSYERGARSLTVLRLVELCQTLEVSVGALVSTALQRATIYLENIALRVDLHALLDNDLVEFRPLKQWARNKLNKVPDGVAEVAPSSVDELADVIGCDRSDLARHLAKFIPDDRPSAEDEMAHVGQRAA